MINSLACNNFEHMPYQANKKKHMNRVANGRQDHMSGIKRARKVANTKHKSIAFKHFSSVLPQSQSQLQAADLRIRSFADSSVGSALNFHAPGSLQAWCRLMADTISGPWQSNSDEKSPPTSVLSWQHMACFCPRYYKRKRARCMMAFCAHFTSAALMHSCHMRKARM